MTQPKTSSLLDRISAHFDTLDAKVIDVPEWDVQIHATPVSIEERDRIYGQKLGDFATLVETIIIKATDADGKRLFTIADRPKLLRRADPMVVVRVAGAILNNDTPKAPELGN